VSGKKALFPHFLASRPPERPSQENVYPIEEDACPDPQIPNATLPPAGIVLFQETGVIT
jgi:hypothetical protein